LSDLEFVKRKILAKVPLASLIGETIPLVHRSGRPMGCCPFHQEKTPSFYIYDQRYYCFGCKEHGDAINFVRKTMGLSFVEALRHLAQKYSVDVPELNRSHQDWQKYRADHELYKIMGESQAFFTRELFTPQGVKARNYLIDRGFTEDELKKWGFGLTPQEGYGLTKYLRQRGYSDSQLVDLALATPSQDASRKPYDFFRNRVMIPIHDVQGRIVAFGGRTLDEDKDPAKYKNSRETRLFNKSEILFGLHEARHHIRAKGRAIVVEGYMDALRLWSSGFPETVACMGTALTPFHMQRLKALTGLVVLVFDGDQAGLRATLKAVDVTLTEPTVIVQAVRLPDGLDPDDCVRKNGRDFFENTISESVYLLDFAIREKLSGLYPHAAAALVKDEILPWLAKIADPLLRDSLIVRIANQMGTSREKLAAQLPRPEDQRAAQGLAQLARKTGAAHQIPPHKEQSSDHGSSQEKNLSLPSLPSHGNGSMDIPLEAPLHLTVAASDLLAHLFYSSPDDYPGGPFNLKHEIFENVDLPELVQFFLDEILTFISQGQSPQNIAPENWQSLMSPSLAQLREKIQQKAEPYKTNSRFVQIQKILLHFKMEKIKKTLTSLRAEATRLWRRPESQEELAQIMKSIKSMEQDRMDVFRKLHPT
jgi:DNA primase